MATDIYRNFVNSKNYSPDLQTCIESTVDNLLRNKTDIANPGMLLGKIQCGKTRTFIGIIALAFDKGYDICVIFTKGTRALAEQTYNRLDSEFRIFLDKDIVKVYDIMKLPPQLTNYLRNQKIIFVVKKEINNLNRLVELFNNYPDLVKKNTLLIDDEADYASVGFRRDQSQQDGISLNVISERLSSIRSGFINYSFLQVTATPYSLYLQPREGIQVNESIYHPIRPIFTTLVPIYTGYIGGNEYFVESQNPECIFSNIFVRVPEVEIETLTRRHQRIYNNLIYTPNLVIFRQAIVNYLVAGTIRSIQSTEEDKIYKSSFIIHIATTQARHHWQEELTRRFVDLIREFALNNNDLLDNFIEIAYDNLKLSIEKNGDVVPELITIKEKVKEALLNDYVGIIIVNSETQILTLLDRNGQLRLDNPFNIFIGGQILDRGITIDNLIGFFYGRNPNTFQQDTVLQHSRMYGNRSLKDMAVTRFYTTNRIYNILSRIHEFDTALRDSFEKGIYNQDDGVVFLEREYTGRIRPCAPNKILVTHTATLRPHRRYLPIGFQTKARTTIQKTVDKIDNILNLESNGNFTEPFLITLDSVIEIINDIESTFEYNNNYDNLGYEWDTATFKAILRRLVDNINNPDIKGKLYCLVRSNRNISRYKNNGTAFSDVPDDGKIDLPLARRFAQETPCIMLYKENGKQELGWKNAEFWWPILITPANTRIAIFAIETVE